MEEILSQYTKFFKKFLEANTTDEYKKILLDVESAITFDGLGKLMEQEDQKYLYLYLDQIQSLDIDEQQRINAFLYAR
ncbi:TPA: hypothetical protein DCZ39_06180 [Patescibacteria group bacterium]|nr:hypothetical protein [Candidatus Gracilibacteria bacterium]